MKTFAASLVVSAVLQLPAAEALAQQAVILVLHAELQGAAMADPKHLPLSGLVGHTDTLPGLIKALGHPSEIEIEAQDYGNIFIVTPRADGAAGFLRLHY